MIGRRMDVFVGVASIPSREASLRNVVQRLLPQARHIGVYLNGYETVPGFLRRPRITVARSQDHGDIRDNGKFYFLNQTNSRYYATVDDDILYPKDYLAHLVDILNAAEQRAAVGVHGALYPTPVVDLFEPRYLLHFKDPLPYAMPVHLLGTGTVLFDQSEWKLDPDEFGTPGMADIWFGVAAARRESSMFAVPRVANWITPSIGGADASSGGSLFFEGLIHRGEQVAALSQACPPGRTFDDLIYRLLSSPRFSQEFSLHQAIAIDDIRSQLGYAPLSVQAAEDLRATLEGQRAEWPQGLLLTADEVGAVDRLMVDVLAHRVSQESLAPVFDVLDHLEGVAGANFRQWATLPSALRYDASPERLVQLKIALLERGMQRSDEDARSLWTAFHGSVDMTVGLALRAEAASAHTKFETLAAFHELAQVSPASASARLYDYFEAIDWSRQPDLLALQTAFGPEFDSLDVQMIVAMAAARSGNRGLAERTLHRLRRRWPWDVDLRLLEAALSTPDEATLEETLLPVLEVLDEVIEPFGLTPFEKLLRPSADGGHWIQHLGGGSDSGPQQNAGPSVTVLMTAYNNAETVEAAINSVLASEGVTLQVVVVDDASTDDTLRVVSDIDDPRVTVVRNDVNVGPYVSRNVGLEHAIGDYIAIADADDWSHPQRLQFQTSILEGAPHILACTVGHIRVRPGGQVDLENHLRFVGDGPMTMLFRRWLVQHIGGFDHVRTRGDIEYERRIIARFGADARLSLGVPLVLATSGRASNSKRFSERSVNLYRAAARLWHELRAGTDNLYVPLFGKRAPFMAPYELLAQRRTSEPMAASQLEEQTG
ncbi:MAG TPA: glycosyltransferase family A protein [Acidimicrobiia bacterium]|nr:glycosyltransferase family A protein [Acidimicrobiia bacterium]